MEKQEHNCETCPMRQKYELKPKSFAGRFWRWHINFCPGWKSYFTQLTDEQKKDLAQKYNFHKYQN